MLVLAGIVAFGAIADSGNAQSYYRRQYYSSWNRHPTRGYYYRRFYYKPRPTYRGYSYHYAICYPPSYSRRYPNDRRYSSRYVYFYNPHRTRRSYWGRLDLEGKPGAQYSLLAPKDRKGKLEDIPNSAFPKLGLMPKIPSAVDKNGNVIESDDMRMLPIPKTDLPEQADEPDDLPE